MFGLFEKSKEPRNDWTSKHGARESFRFDFDAFSSGQVLSKTWLCEKLESQLSNSETPLTIWCYGGWYAVTAFLLFSRGNLPIRKYVNFDIDAQAIQTSQLVNESWIWKNQFEAEVRDCSQVSFSELSRERGEQPDIIINTSCEHFESMSWWNAIPQGQLVALQACNMESPDHVSKVRSLKEMKERFNLSEKLYEGSLDFDYRTWNFTRFMLIGKK